jgi:capsular exopolysaccharide synthesis family protein
MNFDAPAQRSDFGHYVRVLRRGWWVILLFGLVASGLSVAYSKTRTKLYQSSATILIQRDSSAALGNNNGGQSNNQQVISATELEFLNSGTVADEVRNRLHYSPTFAVKTDDANVKFTIVTTEKSPDQAATAANTIANAYLDMRRSKIVDSNAATGQVVQQKIDTIQAKINDLTKQIDALQNLTPGTPVADNGTLSQLTSERSSLQAQVATYQQQLDSLQVSTDLAQGGGPQIITQAAAQQTPVSPTPLRDGIVALLAGLLLGAAFVLLRDYLDDSIRNQDDLEAAAGVPTLAVIPTLVEWRDPVEAHVVSREDPSSRATEAYRSLRTAVQFAGLERELRVLEVTSSRAAEGKTTTATNLAYVLARAGQRVLLVDADLRQPRLHSFFGVSNDVGFTSVLLGLSTLPEAIHRAEDMPNLLILRSGPIPPDPSELLSTSVVAQLFKNMAEAADFVVIDSPPVLPVTDSLILSKYADAVILVTQAGHTGRREVTSAMEQLRRVGAPVIGTALNDADPKRAGYGGRYGYGGYGGYGYGYGYGSGSRRGRKSRGSRGSTRLKDPVAPAVAGTPARDDRSSETAGDAAKASATAD